MTSLPRAAGAERMDEPDQDPAELSRSLVDLQHVNRWLGGYRVVLHHLGLLVARHPRAEYRVLDVATGSADIPLKVAAWARSRGIRMRIVATDNHPTTLDFARRNTVSDADVRVEPADALHLPYDDDAFDFAMCSTALHHFNARDDLLRVMGEMNRVTRIGGIINDLRRSRPAYVGARLLAVTFWRTHPVTAHDGPLSVRRAFTRRELADLARAAALPGARAYRHEPFRVALVWEREEGR
jgi:ubiquinone/menaquinone biosynthesis C-methylase UbiE